MTTPHNPKEIRAPVSPLQNSSSALTIGIITGLSPPELDDAGPKVSITTILSGTMSSGTPGPIRKFPPRATASNPQPVESTVSTLISTVVPSVAIPSSTSIEDPAPTPVLQTSTDQKACASIPVSSNNSFVSRNSGSDECCKSCKPVLGFLATIGVVTCAVLPTIALFYIMRKCLHRRSLLQILRNTPESYDYSYRQKYVIDVKEIWGPTGFSPRPWYNPSPSNPSFELKSLKEHPQTSSLYRDIEKRGTFDSFDKQK
ncbi:hypothetical protein TWF481_005241 [Arthrobotrys musiformis]|uniref:Uncharacterized protein n=1 Tax=Arthrobotrys musiformis TaxID=47236 RepID=A0AAV9WED2_9PEZI